MGLSWRRTMRLGAVVGALGLVFTGGQALADDQPAVAPVVAPPAADAPAAPAPAAPAPAGAATAPAADATKPKPAAQVQPGVTAPAAPAPAPAPAAVSNDVPAAPPSNAGESTVTGGPANVLVATPGATGKPEAEKPLYFNGFGMDVSLSDGSGLYAGEHLYQNTGALYLLPSWKAGELYFKNQAALKKLVVSGRFILSGEFAGTGPEYRTGNVPAGAQNTGCATLTPGNGGRLDTSNLPYCQTGSDRRADYSDIGLSVRDTVYTVPGAEITITPGLGTAIPLSAESRAKGFITSLQPSVALGRSFLEKKLSAKYSFGFTKYFYSSNVPVYGKIDGNGVNDAPGLRDSRNPQLGTSSVSNTGLEQFATGPGGFNPSFGVSHIFDVTVTPTEKFSVLVRYVLSDTFKQTAPSCTFNGGPGVGIVDLCQNGKDVGGHSGAELLSRGNAGGQQFWVSADYQILDYLGAGVALITAGPQRKENGSWQQPFLTTDARNNSTVNFSLTLTTEALAAKLLHKS
jgi:hypothetical protein